MGVPAPFSRETYLEISSARLAVCRSEPTAIDLRNWEQVYAHLGRLFDDCRAHDVPVALLVLPDEFQTNPDLLRLDLAKRGWREADIDRTRPQRLLGEFCRRRGVPCLDLLPWFEPAGGRAYYPNDSHWNREGNHLAAEAVAPWLRQQFPYICRPETDRSHAEDSVAHRTP
jgi:hypothetical protein